MEGAETSHMANYVSNKVVCSKDFLDTYLFDFFPCGPDNPMSEPYISFNKLFGLRSLSEYQEKIGVHIYYGFDFSWAKRDDGRYEVKFCTRWEAVSSFQSFIGTTVQKKILCRLWMHTLRGAKPIWIWKNP